LSHNCGSRDARKPIKDYKNSDNSLVPKKFEPKNGSLSWRPESGNLSQKNAKTCSIVTSPTDNPQPKSNFFLNLN